jgi:hypothetical protein
MAEPPLRGANPLNAPKSARFLVSVIVLIALGVVVVGEKGSRRGKGVMSGKRGHRGKGVREMGSGQGKGVIALFVGEKGS